MALSTQEIVIAKRKIFNYLKSQAPGKAQVYAVKAIDQLFQYLSQHGANPDLQAVVFADLTGDTVVADAACKLYAIVLRKQATGTDAYFKLVNHASTAAGTTFEICLALNASNDLVCLVFPNGLALSTGATLVSSTTDTGGTDSTSGDGPNGMAIIGNP